MKCYIILLGCLVATTWAQQQYTTPIPILKQINKHNEDGSYSYGYEGADGSYKIESKYPNGEVFGKYGYVDDAGKLREIEYGASRRGFEPQGNEINVAPPTLHNNNYPTRPLGPNEEDDGQYREDPSIYYKDDKYNQNPAPAPVRQLSNKNTFDFGPKYTQPVYQPAPQPQPAYQQTFQQATYQQPAYQQPAYQQPAFRPTPTKFSFDDFISNRPQQQATHVQPNYYNPPQPSYQQSYSDYQGPQAAVNVNHDLGSYTVNYRRR